MRLMIAMLVALSAFSSYAMDAKVMKVSGNGEKLLLDIGAASGFTPGDMITVYDGPSTLGQAKLVKANDKKSVWALIGWSAVPGQQNTVRLVKMKSAPSRGIASVAEGHTNFERPWSNRFPANTNRSERGW